MKKRLAIAGIVALILIAGAITFLLIKPAEELSEEIELTEEVASLIMYPRIFLYSQETQGLEVTLYRSQWPRVPGAEKLIVYPDGVIIDNSGEEPYPYILWSGFLTDFDFSEGFVVKGKNTAKFLREKLEYLGLKSEEYGDYLAYWLPKLKENAYNLISFQSEEYTNQTAMNIMPEPDSILRVFVAVKPLDKAVKVPKQTLEKFERAGFTVVDFGMTQDGSEENTERVERITTILQMPMAAKPVIYLYPQETTEVEVTLDYDGHLDFTYPDYNVGWSVTAHPDGTLINHADGREYSYLFWEGTGAAEYDFSQGFVIKGEDTAEFLQEKLAYMGLTPREYNEFIVYWLPRMQNNPYNLITFQGEAYTDTAKLTVIPEPDSLLRVFMAFKPLDAPIALPEQPLEKFERTGFTVIEWGGTEVE